MMPILTADIQHPILLPLSPSTELAGASTSLETGLMQARAEHPGTNDNKPENIEPGFIKQENIKQDHQSQMPSRWN